MARLKLAEDVLATSRDNIARDPIEWAAKTGLIQVPELDLSSPQAAAKSLKARAAVAGEIATYYSSDVRYFRESEAGARRRDPARWAAACRSGGDPRRITWRRGAQGARRDLKDAPEAAVIGGLMTTNGDPMFVRT